MNINERTIDNDLETLANELAAKIRRIQELETGLNAANRALQNERLENVELRATVCEQKHKIEVGAKRIEDLAGRVEDQAESARRANAVINGMNHVGNDIRAARIELQHAAKAFADIAENDAFLWSYHIDRCGDEDAELDVEVSHVP